jgi:hypothetical protein
MNRVYVDLEYWINNFTLSDKISTESQKANLVTDT